jgi:hypothetical protein
MGDDPARDMATGIHGTDQLPSRDDATRIGIIGVIASEAKQSRLCLVARTGLLRFARNDAGCLMKNPASSCGLEPLVRHRAKAEGGTLLANPTWSALQFQ